MFPAALVLAIAVIVTRLWMLARRDGLSFAERFPPISDDEFVARCTPGTSREVALKVRRMVAEFSGIEYERVHPSLDFIWDLE